ncbi:MAG: hypothetical protein PQJ49_13950 [Sphaerochaetaceae bacterium]|nr:hypothetical protein [Sphaerochaetaceae bacterium]
MNSITRYLEGHGFTIILEEENTPRFLAKRGDVCVFCTGKHQYEIFKSVGVNYITTGIKEIEIAGYVIDKVEELDGL